MGENLNEAIIPEKATFADESVTDSNEITLEEYQFLNDVQNEIAALQADQLLEGSKAECDSPHTSSPEITLTPHNPPNTTPNNRPPEKEESTDAVSNKNSSITVKNGKISKSKKKALRCKRKVQENMTTWILAIVPYNYPTTCLEEDLYQPIQSYLWDRLEATPDPVPILNLGEISSGVLKVTCEGHQSAMWLRTLTGETVSGVVLKVIELKDVTKRTKMAWCTKTTKTDVNRILNMLERIHPILNIRFWKIVHTQVELQNTTRIVLMDQVSAEYIKSKKYELSTGVDLSTFKFLSEDVLLKSSFSANF